MILETPSFPLAVVTTITPAAPREPYWAVSEASFKTVTSSISWAAIVFHISRDPKTPSMITNGSLPPDKEDVPRMRTVGSALTFPPS